MRLRLGQGSLISCAPGSCSTDCEELPLEGRNSTGSSRQAAAKDIPRTAHPAFSSSSFTSTQQCMPSIKRLRSDLAAAYRICAAHGFNEGVCNHLTVALPHPNASTQGDSAASLVIRHGQDWSEVTPDSLLIFDNHTGEVLEGNGTVEITALQIHAAIHRLLPSATVVFHTHMPYTTTLTSLSPHDGGCLQMLNQNCLRFFNSISYDEDYRGLVDVSAPTTTFPFNHSQLHCVVRTRRKATESREHSATTQSC